jgi:hypothetical protein
MAKSTFDAHSWTLGHFVKQNSEQMMLGMCLTAFSGGGTGDNIPVTKKSKYNL